MPDEIWNGDGSLRCNLCGADPCRCGVKAGSGSDTSARSESVSDAIGGQRNTPNDPPATVPPSRAAFEAALKAYRAVVIEGEDVVPKAETYRRWLWRHDSAYLEVLRLYDEALAAPPPGESVEGEVQWRTLIDGKLYPIVTLPDDWTGRVRVTPVKEEKEGVVADSGPHGDTPPPSLLRAYLDLPIVAPASAEARTEEET